METTSKIPWNVTGFMDVVGGYRLANQRAIQKSQPIQTSPIVSAQHAIKHALEYKTPWRSYYKRKG